MSEETLTAPPVPEERDSLVIRFAGDSGDGMQLAGTRFTAASALFGNDLATLPNFPAEIRAPQGTLPGVSSFQVQIADNDILTPGDTPDVLVAMNPAALKANIDDLMPGGLLLVNTDAFDERNLTKAGFKSDPVTDGSLESYNLMTAPMSELTKEAVADSGVKGRATLRSKNFFALGLVSWMFNRPLDLIEDWITGRFGDDPVGKANTMALKAGYNYGLTTEAFHHTYVVKPASLPVGEYTNITGNVAVAWGLIAGAHQAKLPLFYGSYPITPASSILEELARHKNFGVRTLQAEDEIAAGRCGAGCVFRRPSRCHRDERTRRRSQVGDDQPRLPGRAADGHRQRPASRTFDGHADQDRAGRPHAGDVRTPRRGAAADRRSGDTGRRVRCDDRGLPDRSEVHDRRCCCSRTDTSQTAPSRGGCRTSRPFPTSLDRSLPPPMGSSCRTSEIRRPSPAHGRYRAPQVSSIASEASSMPT